MKKLLFVLTLSSILLVACESEVSFVDKSTDPKEEPADIEFPEQITISSLDSLSVFANVY